MSSKRALVIAAIMVLSAGCAGEGPAPNPDGVGGGDSTPADQGPQAEQGGACSAQGIAASCNPVAVSGCNEGSCYVTKNAGPSCVCPEGTVATDGECDTTTECAPGNVCAGTSPPGTCSKTCDPNASLCGDGMKCTPIQNFLEYGFCEPN